MSTYTPCRWIDDKCQHGYFIDETEVTFTPATTERKAKHLCPKGATA